MSPLECLLLVFQSGYYVQMTDSVSDLCLTAVSEPLRSNEERLLRISRLFANLMRTADEDDCRTLFRDGEHATLPDASEEWLPACNSNDLTECMRHLRRCKQRGLSHVIWWELGLRAEIERSWQALADFACGLLQQAMRMSERLIEPRYGRLSDGRFCVIGLGKLGGRELNLGSDVDLLFIWQGSGETKGGRRRVTAAEYFSHLSRMLIRLMSERTDDGIVWPVDMRLRPGGDGSPVCLSLEAATSYYQERGQTWERAVLIKARPVAGDIGLGDAFVEDVAPFIYRRYLDYTTVTALAEMKRRINAQAGKRGIVPGFDVKRGQGGIREIEFIIQSIQLLHGGHHAELRIQPSMTALVRLREAGLIEDEEAGLLNSAYCFWRRLEHVIQARNGEQTHRLPEDFSEYLSEATGIPSIEDKMRRYAEVVKRIFSRQMMPLGEENSFGKGWLNRAHEELLTRFDPADRQRICLALQQIDAHLSRGMLPERSRAQLEHILGIAMPLWLDDANAVTAIEAFAELIHAIAGRATWIDLLATHEGSLNWLIGALSASRYLADHIARDPSWLEWPLAREHGEVDIQRICLELGALRRFDDIQDTLASIGRLTDRVRVHCALSIDAHKSDPLTIGEWMADMADASVNAVRHLACAELEVADDFPLVVLAMGKHGSREMGLVSDLDMVFVLVHDRPDTILGKRTVWEHAQRLGRRIIQHLTARPPFGAGFDFDARLRPSGSSGALVTTLSGFYDYQMNDARTWEHQALCRARPVAGPDHVQAAVAKVIQTVLNQPRDIRKLTGDVLEMRAKMINHLSIHSSDIINLKHDAGGLVDIEFLAQYARLAWNGVEKGTVKTLRHLPKAAPKIWRDHAGFLARTYLDYRQMENALRVELWRSIGKLPMRSEGIEWKTMRRHASIHSPTELVTIMRKTHAIFQELLTE